MRYETDLLPLITKWTFVYNIAEPGRLIFVSPILLIKKKPSHPIGQQLCHSFNITTTIFLLIFIFKNKQLAKKNNNKINQQHNFVWLF